MSNVISFRDRKAVGDKHEDRVRAELERRGWAVDRCGYESLSPAIATAVKNSGSSFGKMPDFIVACGSTVRFVDCKSRFPDRNKNSVSRKALAANLKAVAEYDIQVFYVFEDLGVLTPAEVMQVTGVEQLSRSGAYLLIEPNRCHKIDDIFGRPMGVSIPTWGADPLFKVAA